MVRGQQREGTGRAHFDAVVEVDVGYCSHEANLEVPLEMPLPRARKKREVRYRDSRGQTWYPRWFIPGLSAHFNLSPS